MPFYPRCKWGVKRIELFVAVAAGHKRRPPILQGTDAKWWGWSAALAECGITVEFLCAEEMREQYERKFMK